MSINAIDQTVQGISNGVSIVGQKSTGGFANSQVTVDASGETVASSRPTRRSVTIVNHGTTDVFLGTGTVSTSNGILLVGIKGAAITLNTTVAISGITGGGSATLGVWEEYE